MIILSNQETHSSSFIIHKFEYIFCLNWSFIWLLKNKFYSSKNYKCTIKLDFDSRWRFQLYTYPNYKKYHIVIPNQRT